MLPTSTIKYLLLFGVVSGVYASVFGTDNILGRIGTG